MPLLSLSGLSCLMWGEICKIFEKRSECFMWTHTPKNKKNRYDLIIMIMMMMMMMMTMFERCGGGVGGRGDEFLFTNLM